MIIEKDCLVTIRVRMYDMQGNLLEQTADEGVVYLHGHGDIFANLEEKLEGRKVGDEITVVLDPEDSFGEYDPEGIQIVPVDMLGDPETIVPGLVFEGVPGVVNDGRKYRVDSIAEGMAVMDANHPMAGWTLKFEVTVVAVEKPEGEAVGTDDVVVPGVIGFADKIIDDESGDDDEEELRARLDGGYGSLLN